MPSNVDKHSVVGEQPVLLCNYVDVYKNERVTNALNFMEATATDAQIDRFTLKANDVIVTKDSEEPTDIGIPAHVPDDLPGVVCGYHLAVLRPDAARLHGGYLHWALQSAEVQAYYATAATGISRYALGIQDLGMTPVHLPGVPEQIRIANFLDDKTARIDALIAEKERLVERVRELWTSELAAAMAGAEAKLKVRTHYSYYPTVPTSWRVVPFKHAVQFVEGPGILADDFRDEGIPLLRVSCVRGAIATLDGCNFLDPEKVAKKWEHFRVREGDLLISASASMGTVSLVTAETAGAVPYTGIIILRPIANIAARDFIEHFVVSEQFTRQIDAFKAGATIQHFGPTHMKQMVLALPFDLKEQQAIANQLTKVRTENSNLESHIQAHIARLREYRSSLISAAVTGRLDVGSSEASRA